MRNRRITMLAVMAPIVAMLALLPTQTASAASQTYTNACRNNAVAANWDQVDVTLSATSPAGPVAAGSSVTLSGLGLDMTVPSAVFLAGYSLGILHVGTNVIPATVQAVIDGTNTVEGSQPTNVVTSTITTTITDPDGIPGGTDDTATPGAASVTFNNQTWTAGSSGTMNFAEHNDPAIGPTNGGGIIAIAQLFAGVQFHCTTGTVAGSNPGTPSLTSAPTITSTPIAAALAANAGADQTVAPGDPVTLHGSASGGATPYTYAWTQTGGSPTVTLTGANTTTPSFTAPSPATTTAYTFQLQVTDNAATIATDSVVVNVSVAPAACTDPASQCTDVQNFRVSVPSGTLVISTPYSAANPFNLGTMVLDPSGTYLHAQADFGNAANLANGVTITDARPGALPWTAQMSATDFAFSSNSINSCNLGFTGATPQYISGNALGPGSVVTIDVPNGGSGAVAAPGASCSTGVKGGPHTFATAAHGTGSVYVTGIFDLYAPSSTPAGTYDATVTFTIS